MQDYTIDEKSLEGLRAGLPWGTGKLIAEKLGYTMTYVSAVLKGRAINLDIIAEAIRIRDEEQKRINKIKESLKQPL